VLTAKFDLVVSLSERRDGSGGLEAVWEYSADLFAPATVARMAGHYATLLEAVLAAPEAAVGSLCLLSGAERRALAAWNATARPLPGAGLAGLFAAQARARGAAVALQDAAGTLSYAALAGLAAGLAGRLRARLGPAGAEAAVVGLCLPRGRGLVTAMLAVLGAGAAYLPLDPDEPAERLAYMLGEAGAALVLVAGDSGRNLPAGCALLDLEARDGDARDLDAWGREARDRDAWDLEAWDREAGAAALAEPPGGERLAYVMFTSGSTGRPKAVEVPQRAVVRLVCNTDYVALGPGQVVAQAATPLFDAATFEIWGALLNGARLRLLGREEVLDPERLAALLRRREVGVLFLTTALFNRLARLDPGLFGGLDQLLFGGEAADPDAVRAVLAAGPPRRLLHVYGPTEATTFASCHRVEAVPAGARTVPIGRPIANTTLHLLDPAGGPVPDGVVGELHVGGPGLARGYRNRPELTAERFLAHPGLGRLYRTGDLARRRADGALEFVGRRDGQVKLRGFRIEPAEVELQLRRLPGVTDALVRLHPDAAGQPALAAWLLTHGPAADAAGLRAQLRRALPEHMIPTAFVALDAFPLTANGKVDTARLPPPAAAAPARPAALSQTEELLAGIWAEVLPGARVAPDTHFFDAGGHSLMAMQVVARVRAVWGNELPLETMFNAPTLREMAAAIDLSRASDALATAVTRLDRSTAMPLSFAQQRLWFLSQLEPDNPFYNTPLALRLSGPLAPQHLHGALQDVIARHEALRTAFPSEDGRARQAVVDALEIPLQQLDLSDLP
ncbi:MAG: amino acid adenylation domain-containing protein, partial [Acidobacteriaceae bacterium]|nr:amino acid adenylation domain-containing protein [Acidobacteriaceae bacterium]